VFDVSGGVTSGMNAYRVLGQSIFTTGSFGGTAADSLSSPTDMAVDETGNRLFVGDPGSYRVVVYDVAAITNGEGAVNVLGQINLTAEASGVTDATVVGEPTGIAYDSAAQRLFVTDYANSRVMVFDATGISDGEAAVHVIGQLLMTDSTANWDCPACSRSIYGGRGLAYDASHTRLFVSDNAIADTGSTNNRILVFDVNPGTLTDGPTAINIIGSSSYGISSGGAPSTAQNRLDTSHGLFYEPSTDHLFVADFANDRVMVFDADPAVLTPDVSPGVAEPGNDGPNAIDSLGFLDGADAPLYGSVISETSPNAQGFNVPEGMTMDESNHRLYVSDTGNNRVLVFNLNSSNRLVDYTADYVLGQGNFVTRTTGNTATTMNAPRGLAVNGAGTKLFVADALNNRVLVFDTTLLSSGMAAPWGQKRA
jgi:DNA-binding beta-propeller fold protein YncE